MSIEIACTVCYCSSKRQARGSERTPYIVAWLVPADLMLYSTRFFPDLLCSCLSCGPCIRTYKRRYSLQCYGIHLICSRKHLVCPKLRPLTVSPSLASLTSYVVSVRFPTLRPIPVFTTHSKTYDRKSCESTRKPTQPSDISLRSLLRTPLSYVLCGGKEPRPLPACPCHDNEDYISPHLP